VIILASRHLGSCGYIITLMCSNVAYSYWSNFWLSVPISLRGWSIRISWSANHVHCVLWA